MGKIEKKMPKKESEKFKKLLLKIREKILSEVEHISKDTLKNSSREASGDLSGYSLHMADMASDQYDREFSLEIASGGRKILFAIEDAMRRIDDGTFGGCESCGKKISKQRLTALPYAILCIACASKKEKR